MIDLGAILLTTGLAMACIWLLNIIFMVIEILRNTPDWKDDMDDESLMQNFFRNTSLERLEFFQKLGEVNSIFGYGSLFFIITSFIL